ncbi:FAD-dependent oxidoreductase [Candidatus Sumerlaeota bacterium]|nr:FAD-dependent oxidoreductase [Candidatus Sumerlaeota bacterium]
MKPETNSKPQAANGSGEMIGAVLVCGAGVAGIQASLDLSAAGFRVYLVEENPAVGGGMARLDKTFPTGDCATCIISPKLVECVRDLNVDVFTLADVVKLEGEAGNFTATVRQRPRFVDIAKCTACGECTRVCPVEVSSPFDAGIATRRAIDRFYAQAAPNANLIRKNGRAVCSSGCPIDSSVQAYVALIAAGKFQEAADVIRRDNPLPSICGRVCFHPCELECNRGAIDEPINIRGLKRFAMDLFPTVDPPEGIRSTGKSVAVVGSGPAGLAAAHSLALVGHRVAVFESLPVLGGMLAVGIPDYRLPADVLKRDIDSIRSLGVEFKTGTSVGSDLPIAAIEKEYNAVFISTGAHESRKLDIAGEESAGVIHGVDFLRKLALGEPTGIGKRVVVVGGGNTAIDAARTALRVGVESVTVLYRRTRAEMPADPMEIDATLEERIDIQYLAAPIKVLAENGRMTGVECIRMKLGEPDASGRRSPVPIASSEFRIDADTLIPAVSQSADRRMAELLGLKTSKWGTIATDELTMATSKPGVFAGGDVVAGPSSVIEAIAHGKRAAQAIDNHLSGRPLEEGVKKLVADRPNPLCDEDLKQIKRKRGRASRVAPPELDSGKRIGGFAEVEEVYSEEQAQAEAKRCLNCAGCSECMLCVQACEAGAINHEDREKVFDLQVGAVLLTPGFEAFDAARRGEFGYGFAPNVVTNVQFERILSASGPTGGHIRRPSDGATPKRLAFIQCVGSRDAGCENDYCSSVCCMAATKEAILAKEHEPDLDVTVFYLDLRAHGKDFDRYCDRAMNKMGVRYVRSFVSRTYEMPDTRNLQLTYVDPETMRRVEDEFDMVVLSVGMEPSASLQEQSQRMAVALNRWGFAQTSDLNPLETSRPGVYVGGAFQEPKDIPDTVMQASAAAAKAMSLLSSVRGNLVRTKDYPPERDVTDESPRVGVFVCHCGSNIASVVDVERVVETARHLPNVAFADHAIYTCSDDSQDEIKKKIAEYGLNRVVIASCTPRTHESIFRDTLRAAGLNPYLLEMANIRDQCSWVHSDNPDGATRKAEDLIRMAVGRSSRLIALKDSTVPVKNAALVVGGGVAGMTASLALADQGFTVHIVEKEKRLGGTALDVYKTLDGMDVQAFVADLVSRISHNPRVFVYPNSRVSKVGGHIGDFASTVVSCRASEDAPRPEEIEHGVVVLATGAKEHKPQSYGYGQSDRVLTQLELSGRLARDDLGLSDGATIAMIQCVEQRNDERPYCSRVCCTTAVKNALLLKERYPKARIVVLYRDMRTYGFREAAYREAREKGVLFVRYDEKRPPDLSLNGGLSLRVYEPSLKREMKMKPNLVVLAAPMVPQADREELSELLRVPLNADGFFLEAHVKLRPVDFASEGLFLCGTVHAPKSIGETISQANAVAGRAASILSRKEMPVSAQTAWVDQDKCISCMTCVHVCPYMAPMPNELNKAEVQGAVCMGCGSCVAECPAKAIQLRNYIDAQILGAVETLLAPNAKQSETDVELGFLEEVGVAPPRWHKG